MNLLTVLAAIALLAVVVFVAGMYAVKKLMETDEDRILNQVNREVGSRKRVRPF